MSLLSRFFRIPELSNPSLEDREKQVTTAEGLAKQFEDPTEPLLNLPKSFIYELLNGYSGGKQSLWQNLRNVLLCLSALGVIGVSGSIALDRDKQHDKDTKSLAINVMTGALSAFAGFTFPR